MCIHDETCFPGYEIIRELAQGVYTIVYEARSTHPSLHGRPATLKMLRNRRAGPHFLKAVRLNACLDHQRIPPLYEIGVAAERPYSVRMFVEGDDLQNGISSANHSVAHVAAIVDQIAAALDYAHGRGIVHGFVHPRHVLVGKDGSAWLIGFGEYPPPDTAFLGNPLHFAPEQFEGDGAATAASDAYALCETALWLLSGRHPFAGMSALDLFAAKRTGSLPLPIRKMSPSISPAVERVLLRGLAADPAQRHGSPGEFAAALASAANDTTRRRWWFW